MCRKRPGSLAVSSCVRTSVTISPDKILLKFFIYLLVWCHERQGSPAVLSRLHTPANTCMSETQMKPFIYLLVLMCRKRPSSLAVLSCVHTPPVTICLGCHKTLQPPLHNLVCSLNWGHTLETSLGYFDEYGCTEEKLISLITLKDHKNREKKCSHNAKYGGGGSGPYMVCFIYFFLFSLLP